MYHAGASMSDLNLDGFKRFMNESHTKEGRERQRLASEAALIQHGRAYDLEVEDDDGEVAEATLPPPLKRAGRQEVKEPDDVPPRCRSPLLPSKSDGQG